MNKNLYIEVEAKQLNHHGEKICGDVFFKKRIKEDQRIIVVLSDGMGHGVKANVLATLTATMALNFTVEHRDPEKIAEIIMKTLPVCSERKISYATFTVLDLEIDGKVNILEYDNPPVMVFRNNKILDLNRQQIELKNFELQGKILSFSSFYPKLFDRIVLVSDGVSQSGMGSEKFPFGWEIENIQTYVEGVLQAEPTIAAQKIAEKIVNKAVANDRYTLKDDTSCVSVYFREPRKLLIVTGPPMTMTADIELAEIVKTYPGKKIISGGTTCNLIARELKLNVTDSLEFTDDELPPISYMDGIDLVTEGILTLNKVWKILVNLNNDFRLGKGPADQIVKLILESDHIDIVVGTKINEAHQDPNVPVDLEIRRTIISRIADVLENKLLKHITIKYI